MYPFTLNLNLINVYQTKNKYKQETMWWMIPTEYFMSGDPYKGAERTAGVRATQRYYSAWTGTVHMRCWHFGSIHLVYATKKKTPHWAKRFLDIRGAHNWHSYILSYMSLNTISTHICIYISASCCMACQGKWCANLRSYQRAREQKTFARQRLLRLWKQRILFQQSVGITVLRHWDIAGRFFGITNRH